MHRSEQDAARCLDCGAEIRATSDQAFTFGATGALCGECAMRRGGIFDASYDRWIEEPDLSGLGDALD